MTTKLYSTHKLQSNARRVVNRLKPFRRWQSTVLKLALGLMKPDQGRILIDGEDITDYDEEAPNRVRQRIGVGFQEGALFDSLSVYDNVAFRCHERGIPEEIVSRKYVVCFGSLTSRM